MPGERPESKVIRKNCSTIADEITAQGLAQWFATRLSEKEFIASPSAFSALGIPDLNRVTQMLGAVQSRLKTTGTPKEKLEEFITILEDSPALEHLAKEITSKYVSYGGSPFNATISSSNSVDDNSTTGTITSAPSGESDVRRRPLHSPNSQVQQRNRLPGTSVPSRGHIGYGKMILITAIVIGAVFIAGYCTYLRSTGKLTDDGGSRTPRAQTTNTNTVTPTNEPESGSGCTVIANATQVHRAIENDISDWKMLGEELGINPTELDRIGRDQHGEQSRLRETIRVWQDRVPEDEFCWEKLIDALKSMKMIRVAKTISNQHHIKRKEQ